MFYDVLLDSYSRWLLIFLLDRSRFSSFNEAADVYCIPRFKLYSGSGFRGTRVENLVALSLQ
jgi:hypothetical protein